MDIRVFTEAELAMVEEFERELRRQEPGVYGWDIDDACHDAVRRSFSDPRFSGTLSMLALDGQRVVGRIDSVLIPSRVDGSIKAYLDWICVLPSDRRRGIARQMLDALSGALRDAGADEIVGIASEAPDAQQFYRNTRAALIQDKGVFIRL